MTRRQRLPLFLFALCGAIVLGACAPTNAPTEYNATTQANFMEGCTGQFPGSGTTLASSTFCECAYQVFVKNMGIDEFNKLSADLAGDQSKIPQNIQGQLQQCPGWGVPPGVNPENQGPAAPGTTAVPATTAAPDTAPPA